ncbi:MAG: cell division protein FtsQ/DivIB [Candidatus Fimenecus sp.]
MAPTSRRTNTTSTQRPVKRSPQQQTASRQAREPLSNDERRRLRAERARKRRRRRNLIIGVLLTTVILVVGIVLCLTVFFKIADIAVAGDEIYNAEQIIEASGITIGENMFLTSTKNAAEAIEKTLPYVEKAEIKRSLSCTVTITVTKATAVAALEDGDSYILLNASGKVLEDGVVALSDDILVLEAGTISSAVPGETVTFENENAASDFVAVFTALQNGGITGLTQLDVRDRLQITATYQNRIVLKLGEAATVAGKTDFIKATLERCEQNTPGFKGSIDFSIDKKAFQNAEKESTTTVPASEIPLQENDTTDPHAESTSKAA